MFRCPLKSHWAAWVEMEMFKSGSSPRVGWGRYLKGNRRGWWVRVRGRDNRGHWFYFLWPVFKGTLSWETLPKEN